jgi:hypothetical protein
MRLHCCNRGSEFINRLTLLAIALFMVFGPVPGARAQPASTTRPATTAPSKPAIHVTPDGFPAGHDTPEGAACDLARAFIQFDPKRFDDVCIAPFGGGENRAKYERFLKDVRQSIVDQHDQPEKSPNGPKVIAKLFSARHLSKDGPASYAYAVLRLKDVQFVDVGVILRNGERSLNRTLVIQRENGKWYVHPFPASCPNLSEGLNDEPDSTRDFTEVYSIEH